MMEKRSPRTTTATSITIPRPKSAYNPGGARFNDSYQHWMHEYHKQNQLQKSQIFTQNAKQLACTRSVDSLDKIPRESASILPNGKTKGNNLFLSFSSLKVSPDSEENHPVKPYNLRLEPKTDLSDTLDGYRIYKGSGSLTLGVSRQNKPTSSEAVTKLNGDTGSKPANSPSCSNTVHNEMILPDRFVIPSGKYRGQDSIGTRALQSHYQHNHMRPSTKFATLPFHIRLNKQRVNRPLSASSALSSQTSSSNSKEKKGSKSKHNVKKAKPLTLPKNLYRTPTITTIELQPSDAIFLTPRQNGSPLPFSPPPPPPPASDQSPPIKINHGSQHPKSILKNYNPDVTFSPQQLQHMHSGNYHKTLPISREKTTQEIPYHEFLVSTNRIPHASLITTPRDESVDQNPHSRVSETPVALKEKVRPKSAAPHSCSKYELQEKPHVRRKSVTFNSYVSFLTDNKVSTLRSLPVDG